MAQQRPSLDSQPLTSSPYRLKKALFFSRWTRLDGYIFQEIHFPFLMAMLFYNGIFFINTFGRISELGGGEFDIPFKLYLVYFISELPQIFYLTTTLSFLFASLAAISRMSGDSEIIAPQSLGVSFWRMSRPILVYGALLSLGLLALINWGGPILNRIWLFQYQFFLEKQALPSIDPGVIKPIGKNSVLYVDGVDQGKLAGLVFINRSDVKEEILLADYASFYTNRDMKLFGAINISLPLDPSQGPTTLRAENLERTIPLPKDFTGTRMKGSVLGLMSTYRLYRIYSSKQPNRPELGIELFERIFGPLMCLVFSLFAVPIAARHSRLKSGSGFGISLVILALYFIMAKLLGDAATQNKVEPFLAISLPPILFLVLGMVLQYGKDRWWSRKLEFLKAGLASGLRVSWQRLSMLVRRQRKTSQSKSMITGGRANTLLFPSKLDSYIIKSFLSIYLLVQTSVLFVFFLVEYTGISKAVLKNGIGLDLVIRYMLIKTPEVLDLTIFVCLLIATLILLAVMSKNQEITAIRASGGSLQRLCLPLLLCGLLASVLSFYMENSFLPQTNRVSTAIRNRIKDRKDALFSRDVWLKTSNGDIFNYGFFDQRSKRLVDVRRYRFDREGGTIIERIEVPSLIYDGAWISEKEGRAWAFFEKADQSLGARPRSIPLGEHFQLELNLEDLSQKKRRATEFSIGELEEYLKYLKSLGYSENHYETSLYAKYAQPLLPFLMMLLALPLGFQFGRRGTFFGVGTGLATGLLFWGLFEFSKRLGTAGILHPIAAVWWVVVVFGFIALYRFINIE